MNFEKSIKRIEEITALLEKDSVTLEESIALYEEGMTLIVECDKTLKAAEQKFTVLAKK